MNSARTFHFTKKKVANRGVPPSQFLNALVDWARLAHDEIFAVNSRADIYTSVRAELGPWKSLLHRRAVMCEVLRVLGGFESSWNWQEGRDSTNPNVDRAENEEAGIFQVSYDAIAFDPSLEACARRHCGVLDPHRFIRTMKQSRLFAFEFTARLLRFTTLHHGPIKRREIHAHLSRASAGELLVFLG